MSVPMTVDFSQSRYWERDEGCLLQKFVMHSVNRITAIHV